MDSRRHAAAGLIFAAAFGCRTSTDGASLASNGDDSLTAGSTYAYKCACDDRGSPDCTQKLQLTLVDGSATIVLEGRTFRGTIGRDDRGDWLRYTGFGAMQDIGYPQDVKVAKELTRGDDGEIKLVDRDHDDAPKMTFACKRL